MPMFICFVVSDSFATPWTVAYQAPLSMEFSRQEYWSGLLYPAPGESSRLRDRTQISWVSCISRWILYHFATWEAHIWETGLFEILLKTMEWTFRVEVWKRNTVCWFFKQSNVGEAAVNPGDLNSSSNFVLNQEASFTILEHFPISSVKSEAKAPWKVF